MTATKTFDISDFDFLLEEEFENDLNAVESSSPEETKSGYVGAHAAPSGNQKSERAARRARQAVTDKVRKAQEKGCELWENTENVRKNTARVAREKSIQLRDSAADVSKNAKEAWNNSAQRIRDTSANSDARPLTELEDRVRSFCRVCGVTAGLWLMQVILSFIPTIHMRVMDLFSYKDKSMSLNYFWATDGGAGIDFMILIPIVVGILSLLSLRSLIQPMTQKNPEKSRFFVLSKISVFLAFIFVLLTMTMVDDANSRGWVYANATVGFAPVVYLINCLLISALNIVASCKNRKLRSRIKAISGEETFVSAEE